ncbi:MAG: type II toxin-antitoxin system RelE/ParE family toxin [Campylobacterales bacterium]|nr:type II toxin-antitoxin system RelE/ParE family toxin [Campylobacterales bacterium]
MQLYSNSNFDQSLDEVLDYIATDSLERAIAFNQQLQQSFEALPYMPYKFRKSIYFDNEDIRDFIFKGYTIPYLIDSKNNAIILLGIVKYQESL